jgi:hypothetical protein
MWDLNTNQSSQIAQVRLKAALNGLYYPGAITDLMKC